MKLVSQQTIHDGWGRFMLLTVRLANGQEVRRQLEDHGVAAAVLPYDPQRRTALAVVQPRAGPMFLGEDAYIMEAAAGIIDAGESPEVSVRREALEEVGVQLGALDFVGRVFTAPGVSTEAVSLYLAPYAASDRIAAGGGLADENEEIEVLELPLAELARQCDAGQMRDLKTLALVMTLRVRRPDLF